jgi:hypothetical protein
MAKVPVPALIVLVPPKENPSTVRLIFPFTPAVLISTPDARDRDAAEILNAPAAVAPTVTSPPKLTVPVPWAVMVRSCAPPSVPVILIDPLLVVVRAVVAPKVTFPV